MGLDTSSYKPDPNIDPEKLKKMREKVKEKITVARIALLLRHPFFGNMATRLRIVDCDDWCPTAATDGRHLYYNTQFFDQLSLEQVEWVIAHELLHCVFGHLMRRDWRHPMLYNVACDYVVNGMLDEQSIGKAVDQIQILINRKKYDCWTSEEVYDDLFQQLQKQKQKQKQSGGGGGGSSGDDESEGDDDDGDEQQKSPFGDGELVDQHVDWTKPKEKDGKGKDGKGQGRPSYTKEELERIGQEIQENVIASAQAAGAGNTPAAIQRMIKELTEPKMNWRELIRQEIQSTIKNDFTFARPNRKGWHCGAILPGMNFDKQIDICIALDMSGSIGQVQATDFVSEIKGIMDEFREYTIHIWCFDTQVYGEDRFTHDDGRDITEYVITGGGGTDFMCNWKFMEDEGIEPKKFIMFTDGYPGGSWGIDGYCDTVFVIHGHHDKTLEAPFGHTAHYEDA